METSERRLRKAWRAMLARCGDPEHPKFKHYGGRGIGVCAAWADFWTFARDVGPPPTKPGRWTLERKQNDKGYEPGNVVWATQAAQNRNRRNNRRLSLDGRTMILAEWAREGGMSATTLDRRLETMSLRDALAAPLVTRGEALAQANAAIRKKYGERD